MNVVKSLLPLASLLLSTALLLVGHGMQLTLLPLRAAANGLGNFAIGLSASLYFAGFMAGCLIIPQIIARVGHIRSFAVLGSTMAGAILLLDIFDHVATWMVLRFITGAMICGLYTVIESWLNDNATAQTRGRVLAAYTFIVLSAMTLGQFLIGIGSPQTSLPFTVAVLFLVAAIVPVGLTRALTPAPLESTRLRFRLLLARSPDAFAGAVLAGLATGAYWSLGAVFARQISDSVSTVTWFMSTAIAGGAAVQYPLGLVSDRFDRRVLLAGLCIGGAVTSAVVALSAGKPWFLGAVFLFGASTLSLYAMSLTIAADNSTREEFVEIGTSVLFLNAAGSSISPLLVGPLMTRFGATALFWTTGSACAFFSLYILRRVYRTDENILEEKTAFTAAAAESAPTGFDLDPRCPDEAAGDLQPVTSAPGTDAT